MSSPSLISALARPLIELSEAERLLLDQTWVSLGVQAGSIEASNAVAVWPIRLSFAREFPTSDAVDGIRVNFILRIDGSVESWNKSGPHFLRLSKANKEVTIEVFMPISAWEDRSQTEVNRFLKAEFEKAFDLILARLKKEKLLRDENAYRKRIAICLQVLSPN